MNIYDLITEMTPYIEARNWDGLEAEFYAKALSLAGTTTTEAIAAVDLTAYNS